MCSKTERKIIKHFNRVVIAAAGISGVLADGFHSGDMLCAFSMLVWLWQGECRILEEKCLDHLRQESAAKTQA